jgi:hypothetical protein
VQAVPWSDEAMAVRQPDWGYARERIIVARGTLAAVIDEITERFVALGPTLSISLPDRRQAPFQYNVSDIRGLVAARRSGTDRI